MVKHWHLLSPLRRRDLAEFDAARDAGWVGELFSSALAALETTRGTRSPVGVVKAFHLLAPDFFPLWDDEIARRYGCMWSRSEDAAGKYLRFMELNQGIMNRLVGAVARRRGARPQVALWFMVQNCPIGARWNCFLKMLDEYNYVRYTKSWFRRPDERLGEVGARHRGGARRRLRRRARRRRPHPQSFHQEWQGGFGVGKRIARNGRARAGRGRLGL